MSQKLEFFKNKTLKQKKRWIRDASVILSQLCELPILPLVNFLSSYNAGKHKHRVKGICNFRIESWVDGKASHALTIPCVYIPTIPSTFVNFCLAQGVIMYG
mmetsp:Transcript_11922/g.22326  ORF Transcript_11922/g.22326 Transcript_11922/m.22326 type:complete len:102 (-) Transcript_11922:548-853(-)